MDGKNVCNGHGGALMTDDVPILVDRSEAPRALGALRRSGLVVLTWALIGLAQPGVLRPDGFGHLAFFAIGPWAWAARQPGRRAFLAELVGHAIGLAGVFHWMLAFLPWILVPMSIVPALYPAIAGVLLRRVPRTWPLAVLAPAAWMLAEVARWTLPVPLSFGWFRLGMLMHDTAWIVGSAAVFGTWGLGWGLAALGGWSADVARAITRPAGTPSRLVVSSVAGLGPLAGLIALDEAFDAPSTRPGPDVLIVQPGIEQEIKAARRDPFRDMYVPQVTRTLQAIYETRAAGVTGDASQPDLVLWGETFLSGKLANDDVRRAFERGARPAAWARRRELTRAELETTDLFARSLAAALFGRSTMRSESPGLWRDTFAAPDGPEWGDRVARSEPLLPPGTSFLSGVEAWTVIEEGGEPELRSVNGVALWSPGGEMSGVVSKVHMVPGGESTDPLRGIPFVLDAIRAVANNVPDFVGEDEPGVLTLETRSGDAYRMGTLVCYDNAFDDVFAAPVRRSGIEFFVIVSNEAWYEDSAEMDHMLAFSRIAAAATHRSIVRATNSGISCVVDPDGDVVRILESTESGAPRRKMVSGALRIRVPVIDRANSESSAATPFVATEPWQPLGWGGLAAMVLLVGHLAARREARKVAGEIRYRETGSA